MQHYGRKYPRAGYGGRFNDWIRSDDPQPYNSWGNGSAMRVSSVGWMAASRIEDLTANLLDTIVWEIQNELEVLTPVYFPDGMPEIPKNLAKRPTEVFTMFNFRTIGTNDGKNWLVAFTDISECEKGGESITFPMLFTELIHSALDKE